MRGELPLVSAIAPNWNGKAHVAEFLNSLTNLDYPKERLEIIVVDNGSTDGSDGMIDEEFRRMQVSGFRRLVLIRNGRNAGAPAAYNRALGEVDPAAQFVWKLDNDVVVPPESLRVFVERAETDGKIAGVGGRYWNVRLDREEPLGGVFMRIPKRWTKMLRYVTQEELEKLRRPLVMLSGGCCLFRRGVFAEVGPFDERFFLYYDDTEFCLRLVRNGYCLDVVPSVVVRHYGSASTSTFPQKRLYFWVRNLLLCGDRYFFGVEWLIFHVFHLAIFPWKVGRITWQYGRAHLRDSIRLVASGYLDFYRRRWRGIDQVRA